MGLDLIVKRIVGYILPFYKLKEMYKKYIEFCKASNTLKKNPSIYDYMDLITSNTGWDYRFQSDDENYGYFCDDPHIIIHNTKPKNLSSDYFSIDGKKPVKTFSNKKWQEFIYDEETKSYNYILSSTERGYGFNAPEVINLIDLDFEVPNLNMEEHHKLKKDLEKLCIDLEKFKYSDYIMSFYI